MSSKNAAAAAFLIIVRSFLGKQGDLACGTGAIWRVGPGSGHLSKRDASQHLSINGDNNGAQGHDQSAHSRRHVYTPRS